MFCICQNLCIFLHIKQAIKPEFLQAVSFLALSFDRNLHHYDCLGIPIRGERPKQKETEGYNTGSEIAEDGKETLGGEARERGGAGERRYVRKRGGLRASGVRDKRLRE